MSLKIKLWGFFAILLIGLVLFLQPYYLFITRTMRISPVKALFYFDSLKTFDKQVNILLLGIAGKNHDGPNLSDSIVVANYNFRTNRLTMISIPRDIWSNTLFDKINSAYAYGEAKKTNAGFILAKAEVGAIVGLPIHYAATIDFEQFKELIDFLGGVEVEVENSFVDEKFPITGRENDMCDGDSEFKCRYQTVKFTKGKTIMDGDTALKFVRSRNSEGREGNDFAREKRQQKVYKAIIDKLFSKALQLDLKYFQKIYPFLDGVLKRDITNQQLTIILRNIFLKGNFRQQRIGLNDDFFVNPDNPDSYDGLWVLLPKKNDFAQVHQYIDCVINEGNNCDRLKPKSK